jgi:hypothetical protein
MSSPVQEEISLAVVDALRLHLVGGETQGPTAQRHTPSVEAYELFLRGRFFANQRTEDSLVEPPSTSSRPLRSIRVRARVRRPGRYLHRTPPRCAGGAVPAREGARDDCARSGQHAGRGAYLHGLDPDVVRPRLGSRRAPSAAAMALDPGYLWAQQWYGAYLAPWDGTGRVPRREPTSAAARSTLRDRQHPRRNSPVLSRASTRKRSSSTTRRSSWTRTSSWLAGG